MLKDYVPDVDHVRDRENVDLNTSKQGEDLIDFLKDNKLIMMNGRGNHSEYTCIKTNGNSVVDYIACDHKTSTTNPTLEIICELDVLHKYDSCLQTVI